MHLPDPDLKPPLQGLQPLPTFAEPLDSPSGTPPASAPC